MVDTKPQIDGGEGSRGNPSPLLIQEGRTASDGERRRVVVGRYISHGVPAYLCCRAG